ncbi:MAG TPA: hypothetical protein VKF41_07810 [Bryobacteraceae bacterium]|nr:hypothetical protein [Bryobacteraceae bacterium]
MSVRQALGTYPYLFWNILWLSGLLLAARWHTLPSHRRLTLRLGLIMVPNGLFSLAYPDHWKDYWNPNRVGGWVVGPEDVLFAFNVGATACLAAALLYRGRLIVAERPVSRIGRTLALGIPAQCLFLVLFSMFRSGIGSMILAQLVALVPVAVFRSGLWRFSAAGGIGFPLIYCGILKSVYWICPDFVSCWRSTPPWGLLLFGIPVGEIVWAVSFGLFWPLFAGFVFDLRLSAGRPIRGEAEAAPRLSCGQGT